MSGWLWNELVGWWWVGGCGMSWWDGDEWVVVE